MNLVEMVNDLRACALVRDVTQKIKEFNNKGLETLLDLTYGAKLPVTLEEVEDDLRYEHPESTLSLEGFLEWVSTHLAVSKPEFLEGVCSFLKSTDLESNDLVIQMFQGDLGIKLSKAKIRALQAR